MTIDLALEYIPRRMKELGFDSDYHIRLKHLVLSSLEKRTVEAYRELIIVVEIGANLKVESYTGYVDTGDFNTNEYQYEHQGLVIITNKSGSANTIKYIQVIPKFSNKPCP